MRIVVQRVRKAAVVIDGSLRREIGPGLVVLLGIAPDDNAAAGDYLADKVAGLRIFSDQDGKMNLSVQEIGGSCLVISQFTLFGDCRRGKRPSFTGAAAPDVAIPLYDHFVSALKYRHQLEIQTGEFGADMLVEIENDGPVTLLLDSDKLF